MKRERGYTRQEVLRALADLEDGGHIVKLGDHYVAADVLRSIPIPADEAVPPITIINWHRLN